MKIPAAALAVLMLAPNSVWASLGDFASTNPLGQYGETAKQWQPGWSDAFFKCMDKYPQAQALIQKITTYQIEDVGAGKKWCSSRDLTDPAYAKQFMLANFKVLAGNESSYDPNADNSKSPHPPALGLFQIGVGDAKSYGCEKPGGGAITTEQDLKVGENSVCCAVRIASSRSATSKNANVLAEGSGGIMGDFWEPMRKQNTSGAKQDEMVGKVNAACEQVGHAGGIFTAAEIEDSRRMGIGASASIEQSSDSDR